MGEQTEMRKGDEYHSADHQRDNKRHIYPDCYQGRRLDSSCQCSDFQDAGLCSECQRRASLS